ncbi:MAG: ABC transporter substrate-binding protein [Actinobacteria bacterium]|uniref:Unannotated protein n=1 Tax=freshwater metagenome TaxID=449393 RepID=A0A6J7CUF0_9ZZZZ|nr:ABC transporter substrate-binding protein [Actinomycetota bacterium]
MRATSHLPIFAVFIVALAGCGDEGQSKVPDSRTTIVLAAPLQGPDGPLGRDTVRAARMQLKAEGLPESGPDSIRLAVLDESDPSAEGFNPEHVASLVSDALESGSPVVAWVGGIDSDTLAVELPRLNEVGVIAVSPSASGLPFTQADPAFPGAPIKYYPAIATFGVTFARTASTDIAIAGKMLSDLRRRGITRVLTVDGGDTAGDSYSSAVEQLAPRSGITLVGHESVPAGNADWEGIAAEADTLRAQAIIWTGSPGVAQASFWSTIKDSRAEQLMVTGPAVPPGFLQSLPAVTGGTIGYSGALPSALQGSQGARLEKLFKEEWGWLPTPGALRGAAAMKAVLRALSSARHAGEHPIPSLDALRLRVTDELRRVRTVNSLLGPIRLDAAGNWPTAPVGAWKAAPGGPVFVGVLP